MSHGLQVGFDQARVTVDPSGAVAGVYYRRRKATDTQSSACLQLLASVGPFCHSQPRTGQQKRQAPTGSLSRKGHRKRISSFLASLGVGGSIFVSHPLLYPAGLSTHAISNGMPRSMSNPALTARSLSRKNKPLSYHLQHNHFTVIHPSEACQPHIGL